MRKLTVLTGLIFCWSIFAYSQEELIPPRRSRMAKVGLFGAFTPGVIFPDVKPINDFLKGGGAAPLKEDGVFLWGGAGAAYIMLVPNLRVGGVGMSGSIKSTLVNVSTNVRKEAELRIGYGGVTIEYVVPIFEELDVAGGVMLGTGGIDLVLRQSNGASDTWQTEQDFLGNGLATPTPNNVTRTISGKFFVYVPSVYIEYSILGWLAVRGGASYVGMVAPSWHVDDNYEVVGVPGTVNGKGFMANIGIMLGTF
jgi:hypothetical protein